MSSTKYCSIEDCDKPLIARGLCTKHYQQLKHRNELPPLSPKPSCCIAPRCRRKIWSNSYCTMHYQRWKHHGRLGPNPLYHGQYKTPIYNSWDNMIQRCYNPKDDRYHRYGGRGIRVCIWWRTFKNFYEDMAPRPKERTIDRIDNDGNYSCGHCPECVQNGWPANCRWATSDQQHANQTHRNKYSKPD